MSYRGIDIREAGDRLIFRASLKDTNGDKVTTGATSLRLFRVEPNGRLASFDFADKLFKLTTLTTASVSMTHRTANNGAYNTGIWTYVLEIAEEESTSSSSSSSSTRSESSLSSESSSSTSTTVSSSSSSSSSTSSASSSSTSQSNTTSSSSSTLSSSSSSSSSSSGNVPTTFQPGDIIIAQVTNTGASPESQEREFQYGHGVLADMRFINGEPADESDDPLDVNVVQVRGSDANAAALAAMCAATTIGAVVSDGSNTATTFKTDLTHATTNVYGDGTSGGAVLAFTTGQNTGISRRVTAFNTTTDFVTVEAAFPNAPAGDDEFIILGRIEI